MDINRVGGASDVGSVQPEEPNPEPQDSTQPANPASSDEVEALSGNVISEIEAQVSDVGSSSSMPFDDASVGGTYNQNPPWIDGTNAYSPSPPWVDGTSAIDRGGVSAPPDLGPGSPYGPETSGSPPEGSGYPESPDGDKDP